MSLKSCLAELIGTFALVFAAAGAICMDAITGGKVGQTGVALAYGFTVTAMVYTYGTVSGGHFNPAVTAAMFANRRIDAVKGIFYVVSQLLGAALAGVCLKAVLHNHPDIMARPPFLGVCDLADVSFKAGTLLEAIGTFFLVSAIYPSAVEPRRSAGTAPVVIGLAIASGVLAFGPLTGAAMNPARAFGPAVATGHWANAFVYWIGRVFGGVAAGLLHENFFLERKA